MNISLNFSWTANTGGIKSEDDIDECLSQQSPINVSFKSKKGTTYSSADIPGLLRYIEAGVRSEYSLPESISFTYAFMNLGVGWSSIGVRPSIEGYRIMAMDAINQALAAIKESNSKIRTQNVLAVACSPSMGHLWEDSARERPVCFKNRDKKGDSIYHLESICFNPQDNTYYSTGFEIEVV